MADLTVSTRDAVRRLSEARAEVRSIADSLWFAKTSKQADRQGLARRLNAVNASLGTVELAAQAQLTRRGLSEGPADR